MPSRTSSTRPIAGYSAQGAWLSHAGLVRKANEDACLAGSVISSGSSDAAVPIALAAEPWIVAVSDGIGGHRAGAEASQAVVKALAGCAPITPTTVSAALDRVNRELCARGRREPECAGMGATIAGIGSGPRGLFAFNVGDSRVYKFSRHRLMQVTRDDSEAEELIRAGLLQRDQVRPGFLHALTRAIGGRAVVVAVRPHLSALSVATRARFLVCSDGITDMLPHSALQETIATESEPAAAVRALFRLTMEAGGLDNITLAVFDVARDVPRAARP
jgi:serine/threonine protein phosphatase PrpC